MKIFSFKVKNGLIYTLHLENLMIFHHFNLFILILHLDFIKRKAIITFLEKN
jgi:hypothetical protein